ncbi:MAG: TonB-dependent receptor, partial [Bacteroidota bacterium]|nr:TonB-dependent receptor [Bacteroidota bacterium]
AGITYDRFESGINAGLFYNVKGPTLAIVGAGLFPDIYEKPFHSLNFSINKKIGKDQKTMIEFKVSNLLDSSIENYYQSYNADNQIYNSKYSGRSFSVGVSYKF